MTVYYYDGDTELKLYCDNSQRMTYLDLYNEYDSRGQQHFERYIVFQRDPNQNDKYFETEQKIMSMFKANGVQNIERVECDDGVEYRM